MISATTALPAAVRDPALLLARLVLGAIFIAHGWQKAGQNGIAATTEGFADMGVPLAGIAAPLVACVELIGGALLILGVLTSIAGLAITMAVAAFLVHLGSGVFVTEGGWELVGALGAGALLLAAVGPGRIALAGRAASRSGSRARSASTSAGSGASVA